MHLFSAFFQISPSTLFPDIPFFPDFISLTNYYLVILLISTMKFSNSNQVIQSMTDKSSVFSQTADTIIASSQESSALSKGSASASLLSRPPSNSPSSSSTSDPSLKRKQCPVQFHKSLTPSTKKLSNHSIHKRIFPGVRVSARKGELVANAKNPNGKRIRSFLDGTPAFDSQDSQYADLPDCDHMSFHDDINNNEKAEHESVDDTIFYNHWMNNINNSKVLSDSMQAVNNTTKPTHNCLPIMNTNEWQVPTGQHKQNNQQNMLPSSNNNDNNNYKHQSSAKDTFSTMSDDHVTFNTPSCYKDLTRNPPSNTHHSTSSTSSKAPSSSSSINSVSNQKNICDTLKVQQKTSPSVHQNL